jgi:hypothetical protein
MDVGIIAVGRMKSGPEADLAAVISIAPVRAGAHMGSPGSR